LTTWDNDNETERKCEMTTTTKARKTSKKPARHVRLYGATSNPMVLEMTIGKDALSYLVKRIHADWGKGFEFTKLDNSDSYAVNIDMGSGKHTCTCLGNERWNHCKHVDCLVQLMELGRI
jgi:hypothetical protein